MTDRYNALTVILERDTREDDAQPLIDAIRQFRGVLKVEPHTYEPCTGYVTEVRLRADLTRKLFEALK